MKTTDIITAARENLLSYACTLNPNYQIPRHLVEIAKVLQRVESGELKRVILTIPPRHGKSMLCSQFFPAWYMGRNPEKYLISATYGQELSDDFGRAVRNQLQDPLYQAIFSTRLASDSQAASRFSTTAGGTYFSVGAGGPIVGRGAHLFIIDDPIKNREDAESSTIRRKLQEWYTSVAYTRLMPGGAVFVISTRWHQNDLIGWLLKEHVHEGWEVINFKAIGDDGQPLWPESYPLQTLEQIKQTVGPYDWNCLYQQSPIAKDTAIFDIEKITGYDSLPKIQKVFTGVDPAISEDSKACLTALCTLGYGEDGHIYDLETIAGRWSFLETLQHLEALVGRQRPHCVGIESNAYQKSLWEATYQRYPLIQIFDLNADKNKFRRAKTVSHLIEKGLFHTNNKQLIDDMLNFDPTAIGDTSKDRVDALVHALHMVQQYASIPVAVTKKSVPKNSFDLHWQREVESFEQQTQRGDFIESPWVQSY